MAALEQERFPDETEPAPALQDELLAFFACAADPAGEGDGEPVALTGGTSSAEAPEAAASATENADLAEMKTCGICLSTLAEDPSLQFVQMRSFHGPDGDRCKGNFCTECFHTFVRGKIEEKASARVQCPSCPLLIRDFAFDSLFASEPHLLGNHATNKAEWLRLEAARERRLHSWVPSPMDVVRRAQLANWSAGKDVRPCPGCLHLIEKNGGCNHMTCSRCRHEFHWCCLQPYSRKHHKTVCVANSYYYSSHPGFGPNAPVRAVTKTLAVPVAVAGVAVAGSLLPVVTLPVLGVKKARRMHRRRRIRIASQRRLRQARALSEAATVQEADRLVHALGMDAEQGIMEPHRCAELSAARFAKPEPCPLGCTAFSHTTSVQAWLEHLSQHPRAEEPVLEIVELPRLSNTITANTAADAALNVPVSPASVPIPPHGAVTLDELQAKIQGGCFDFGPRMEVLRRERRARFDYLQTLDEWGVASALDEALSVTEEGGASDEEVLPEPAEPAERDFRGEDGRIIPGWWDLEIPTCGQTCACGVGFPDGDLEAWCQHIVSRNPARARAVCSEPGACNIRQRPGFLCACTGFTPSLVDPELCECLHPKLLH